MTKLNSAKKSVICKDCGHTGAPKARLTGKAFLLIPFLLVFLVVSLGLGIIVLVVAYFFMRVDTCTACGSENVDDVVSKALNAMPQYQDEHGEGAAFVAAEELQRTEVGSPSPATDSLKPVSVATQSPKDGNSRLVACKECGNMISRKAEICPKCGFRYRPSAQSPSGPGFIVSLFKLVGGVVGAVLGLMFAVSLLSSGNGVSPARIPDSSSNSIKPAQIFGSGGDSVAPARKLEIHCDELSKALPVGSERDAAYQSCIAGGRSAIRAQERINAEGR